MTACTLGEVAGLVLGRVGRHAMMGSGSVRRIATPMRRDSIEAGSFEKLFFATPAAGECDRMLRAARHALDAGRRLKRVARAEGRMLTGAEAAIAALTAGAIRVFEELCTLARLNKGHVYPSYDRLAKMTALGRATVARALGLLEGAGFLRRQRRFRRIEGEGAGPRYAQTSNAYRPTIPPQLDRLLPALVPGRARRDPPIADDTAQHLADQADSMTAMRAGLSCRELARVTAHGTLGAMLERLGAAIDRHAVDPERESHTDPRTLPNSIDNGVHRPIWSIGSAI